MLSLAAAACSSSDEGSARDDGASSALTSAGCVAQSIATQAGHCDAAPPTVTPEGFRHDSFKDAPMHRGRDMFFRDGEPQWVLAKFAYGTVGDRLKDEDVDIFVLTGCGAAWKKLARVRTSGSNHSSREVEGFEDDEGRVLYQIPDSQRLPIGRHRVRLVAAADGTATELFIEVLPQGTELAVIDLDGTMNEGIAVEVAYKIFDATSPARDGSTDVLQTLAQKGYRPYYLTARADLDIGRTRDFIRQNGFPDGVIETTSLVVGEFGAAAAKFKEASLDRQKARGLVASFAFGNQKSDAEAFDHGGIPREHRFFFAFDDQQFGGRRVDSYVDLASELHALPSTCH